MRAFVGAVGNWAINGVWSLGFSVRFFIQVLRYSALSWRRFDLILREMYGSGVLSLVIITTSGLFVGMVLALQGYYTLSRFGATDSVGAIVALSVVRELGPVISALLFSARAGSAMTAGIGMMKAREELVAMDTMGVNPLSRVIAPKFWGGVLSLPLLSLFFSTMSIFGGFLIAVPFVGIDPSSFWSLMQSNVRFLSDIGNGIIKSVVFAGMVCWIAIYQGYVSQPTVEGVSSATTRTVVISALAILFADFVLTAIMFNLS